MTSNVTASVWELCDREKKMLHDSPSLIRMIDVCGLYGYNPATVCNIFYQWRRADQWREANEQGELEIDGAE